MRTLLLDLLIIIRTYWVLTTNLPSLLNEVAGPTIKMIASSVELVILISGETGAMIQLNFCRVGPHTEDKVIVMKIDFR